MAHKQTGNQRWQRDIQFLSEYEKRQNSVRGGLIDPMLFNILSGSGPDIRLGAGFTQAEKTALGFLGSDRSRRNVLKEEMKNAEQGIASGKTYSGQAGSANHDLQNAAYITAAAPAAAGAVAGTAVGATIGATLGAHAAAGLAGTAVGSVAAGATGAAAGGIAGGIGGGIAGGVLGAASVAALPLAAVAIVMLIIAEHKKKKAKATKKKRRSSAAAKNLMSNFRGFTPTGALRSREGAMRIARSQAKSAEAK